MTVKCSGIKCIMLATSDMPRSLAYYRESLGFRVKSETRGVVFLSEPMNVTGDSWAANFRDPDGHLLSVFGPERKA